MSAIRCRIRVAEDSDPKKTQMLAELQIAAKKQIKVFYLETLLNTKVLANVCLVVRTNIPSIALQFLGQATIHLEDDDRVWGEIRNVLNM